ncbi:MAG: long-chain-acyl-CoA synthetase [Deltaproteobacteria bacterium]|nr:long-chain-acyl-CoA synthetase [Deltaproteobacteria bacterium]
MAARYYSFLFKYVRLLAFKNKTLGNTLEKMAAKRPDDDFLLFENDRYTFDQYNRMANRRAHYFSSQGVRKGTVVLLLMENRPEFMATVAGLGKLGAITAAVNYNLRGVALANILNASTANHIIVGAECLPQFMDVAGSLEKIRGPNIYMDTRYPTKDKSPAGSNDLTQALLRTQDDNPSSAGIGSDDLMMHIYTSGTTGLPKPAMITHYRWYGAGLLMGHYALGVKPSDTVYCPLPLYHSNGILIAFASALVNGGKFALTRRFSASGFWEEASRHGATCAIYIGELLRYLVNTPSGAFDRNHKVTRVLGNGLRPDIWGQFKYRFGIDHIREFYASTEGNAYLLNLDDTDGSVGKAALKTSDNLRLVRYDIASEQIIRGHNGFAELCRPGEPGELLAQIKALTPFHGYANPKDTEKKILRNVLKTGDAFFSTGDLLRKDDTGHYYFIDRIGDTFRWKGENVSTHEVEEIITSGVSWVDFATVYGVEIAKMDGKAGMAALTISHSKQFNPEIFFRFVEDHLPHFSRPAFVRVQTAAAMTGTFKKDKKELKASGFDPAKVKDPMFYLDRDNKTYSPLDAAAYKRIQSGWLKL